ncbi:BZ3500_MvSof-1268-A1-R1_Chr6-2g08456 [Microbotryum saponariae]|uniref:BZ3500_MvSof-1268-A1-R1_Chr6-2g08456 protein n=1 Tax=Microbotryum saponariae TaxID=289078 RepID=A0A2X0KHN2_9BASI|nr:BZ3500_MvSof-1268-A1-R1_Chr6-2g08456 [Microbotryum saponariae]SDA07733.1 BZ3501_MvSof-1269-A2-R1_Chr6-1g08170 [Microbotryum saponariae]
MMMIYGALSLAGISLASTVSAAAASSKGNQTWTGQLGYGRFPCGVKTSSSGWVRNQTMCKYSLLVSPGANTNNTAGNQGDGHKPKSTKCTADGNGYWYCGIANAICSTDSNCDNGRCVKGICASGFDVKCGGDDTKCSGDLYCNAADYSKTSSGTCGGRGAFCQARRLTTNYTAVSNYKIWNASCKSGYCNTMTGNCDTHKKLGQVCKSDPAFHFVFFVAQACETGLECVKNKCAKSKKSMRAKRNTLSKEVHHPAVVESHRRRKV